MIVAADSRGARNTEAVREVRREPRGLAIESISERGGKPLCRSRRPLDAAADADRPRPIEEIEEVRIVAPDTLGVDISGNLIPGIDRFVQAPLKVVLMRIVYKRNLIVVTRVVIKVRQRKQTQQSFRLRADAVLRNHISSKRQTGKWIDNLHRLAQASDALGKVSLSLGRRRHSSGHGVGISILQALIAEEKCRSIVPDQAGNPERPSHIERAGEAVVGRFRSVLSGERVRSRVEPRVIHENARVARI